MSLLDSRAHTAGNITRWRIDYDQWLDNAANIQQFDVTSNSATCTVSNISILGREGIFFLNGGSVNEQVTLSLVMGDSFSNVKKDTIAFCVVAP